MLGSADGSCSGRAIGAQAPVDDLGLVDREALVVRCSQTRGVANGAVDVGHGAAGATHEMVMVVADPQLIAGSRAGRLDPAYQSGDGESAEYVVHRLVRDLEMLGPHPVDHRIGVDVRVGVKDL